MTRKPAKPAQDVAALPAGAKAADRVSPQPPVSASTGAGQAQAGGGGAPADLPPMILDQRLEFTISDSTTGDPKVLASLQDTSGASMDAAEQVATQMPEVTAAEPPAAGDAPAANPNPGDPKTVTVSIVANPVLRVTGPAKGRWRAGRHFTPETVIIPVRDLNEDEMAALHTDPELVVQFHNDI
jgi:hypothetical protein